MPAGTENAASIGGELEAEFLEREVCDMCERVLALPVLLLIGLVSPLWPTVTLGQAASPPEAVAGSDRFPGSYRVSGQTTDIRSGDTRHIEGIVVLSESREGYYTAKSDLETQYPSEGGPVDAHVIGTGTGRPSGDAVVGTAETQLVLGAVPGLGAEFALAPRSVGPRLLSTWTAKFRRDGSLVVEVENRGEAGENYSPTRTKLKGTRIDPSEGAAPPE